MDMRRQRRREFTFSSAVYLLLIFIAVCPFVTASASEQGRTQDTPRMDEVTVTATKMETDVYRVPTNIAVIPREEIEKYPSATNIFELIQQANVPGVFMPQLPGSLPVDGSLSTRGSEVTPWAVRILVNGIEFNKGNGYIVPPRIPMHDIERIEIIKTPSAEYGDQAIYGVINIVTRVSDRFLDGKAGISFDSFGSSNYFAVLNGQSKGWEYFLDVGITRFNGYQDGAFEDDNTLYTRISYNFDDTSSLTFHGSHYDSDANYANSLTFEQFRDNPEQNPGNDQPLDDDYDLYALSYEKAFGRNKLSVKVDYKDEVTKMFFSGLYFDFDEWEIHPEASFVLRHDLGSMKNKVVLGGEYRYHEIDTGLFLAPDNVIGVQLGDRHREDTTWAVYLQDELMITDSLTLTAGVRYDDYEQEQEDPLGAANNWTQSDSHISPKIGFTYAYSDAINFFGGFNSGFKSPVRVPGAAASESLDPEKIIAYELGIRGFPATWLNYELALFYHQVDDKIVSIAPQRLENVGEVEAKGMEMSLAAEFRNGFYANVAYTYQDSTFKEYVVNGVSYNDNPLPNVPEHILGAWLGYRHATYGDFAVNPSYHGEMSLNDANTLEWDGFWLLGAKYTKHFVKWKPSVKFFIVGENLTDEDEVSQSSNTRSTPGAEAVYPVPGIRLFTGIQVSF
jgi:iron complex outermembrane recepter protein